ncbi:MAG: hypothetical protein JWM47_993 [Acidimicrobiales bacterium]|nr:hypothetical protein [Acidimicrobiales bacterium]
MVTKAADDGAAQARASEKAKRRMAMGAAIRSARGEQTQAEIGARLGDVPQTTISRWEQGLVELSYEQVMDLERALGVSAGTLGRAAGYLRPGTRLSSIDIMLAIREDEALVPDIREIAASTYDGFVKASAVRRT